MTTNEINSKLEVDDLRGKMVFVYGTLVNSGMMSGLEDMGVFRTAGPVLISDQKSFPRCIILDRMDEMGLSHYADYTRTVIGKAYMVTESTTQSDINYLMAYEGYPEFYDMVEIDLVRHGSEELDTVTALMFHANEAASIFRRGSEVILTSDNENTPVQWYSSNKGRF